jgi:hypothetical protein
LIDDAGRIAYAGYNGYRAAISCNRKRASQRRVNWLDSRGGLN